VVVLLREAVARLAAVARAIRGRARERRPRRGDGALDAERRHRPFEVSGSRSRTVALAREAVRAEAEHAVERALVLRAVKRIAEVRVGDLIPLERREERVVARGRRVAKTARLAVLGKGRRRAARPV
jgi:hypothetical protein